MITVKKLFKISAFLFSFLIIWNGIEGSLAFSYEDKTSAHEIKLSFGTPVLLKFVKKITSETFQEGSVVDLEIGANIYKDGIVVIPEGLPAKGVVISGSSKYFAGKGGELTIGNFYIMPNDSQRIKLHGIMRLKGKDRRGSLVLGQCCILGYLIQGKEAYIEKGRTFRAVLSRDEIIRQVKQP